MGGSCPVASMAPPASLHDARAGLTLGSSFSEARMVTPVLPMEEKSTVPVSGGLQTPFPPAEKGVHWSG